MHQLSLQPLHKTAFAPFGDVIETEGANSFDINNGNAIRFHDLAQLQFEGEGARALISVFRCKEFQLPVTINMMERHPLGSQAFFPLNCQSYMSIVAQDKGGVPVNPRAFLVKGNQGINLHVNTWHATLTTLGESGDFLVVDRGGKGDNLQEYFFDTPYCVS